MSKQKPYHELLVNLLFLFPQCFGVMVTSLKILYYRFPGSLAPTYALSSGDSLLRGKYMPLLSVHM